MSNNVQKKRIEFYYTWNKDIEEEEEIIIIIL